MKFLEPVFRKFGKLRGAQFFAKFVDDNPQPESVVHGEFLVVGNRHFQKWVYFRCPCKCGKITMLPLSKKNHPSWNLHIDWMYRPTLYPSIRELDGCISHYWIQNGLIKWCKDSGRAQSRKTTE